MKRTHLPLNGLRVLDAAARHLSFTRAADELAVTPAAVGQQIRALEDTLGVVLFRRTTRGLELTPEGEAGLEALRSGFLQFEEAVRAMQSGQSSKSLTIAAPRDFAAKWLAPRLADYAKTDPELRFILLSSDDGLDFTQANLDLAVCYAKEAGLSVIDAGLAIDAAASGFGRATVPALLAAGDLAAGRVAAFGETPTDKAYWLIAPLPQWRQKKVRSLVAALAG
jgi:LysR family glycine cleavage system transcriptional activator